MTPSSFSLDISWRAFDHREEDRRVDASSTPSVRNSPWWTTCSDEVNSVARSQQVYGSPGTDPLPTVYNSL
ncbi:hypothetical protein J6590_039140 [Homalodisca vitripennis]|nr:hypothetical protein J6590_039140 [Homalodisca vitripennis]